MLRHSWFALVVGLVLASMARGERVPEFTWLEGESPSSTNLKPNLAGWGNKQFLSGEKWLHVSIDSDKIVKDLPDAGGLIRYEFAVKQAGSHALWARIGFEFARSAFAWRIDDGEWKTVNPDVLTSDLMEIDFFCEVAWLKLADPNLAPGVHAIEFRLSKEKDEKGQYRRVLFALDALCLSAGPFQPNGKFPPGEDGRDVRDRKAGESLFQLPEPSRNGERTTLPLKGLWEIARDDEQLPGPVAEPIPALPKTVFWRGIEVPGDKNTLRPDLVFAHRVWYRTRLEVPAGAAGQSFLLVFPQNNLNTTVYVNGVLCGFDKNPFARVQIDISKSIKPGINEVWVGIRDAWYGYSANSNDPLKLRKRWNLPKKFLGDGFQDLAYPIWNHAESGILVTPELVVAGPVYASDVFCKPSVANRKLDVDVTLTNPTGQDLSGQIVCEPVNLEGITEKSKAAAPFTLKAGESRTHTLTIPGEDLKLWWPDSPTTYRLWTTVQVGGRSVDVSVTRFGFREWTIRGKDFLLNGVPWHGWADTHFHDSPKAWLDFYRKSNQTFMRFWGTSWMQMPPEEALTFFDRNGVVVRRSGILDGEAIGYMAVENDEQLKKLYGSEIKMELMNNWKDQLLAQVKGERNHPSVMIWSIENEWLYINCINLYGGLMDQFENAVVAVSDAVRKLDPTRPTMTDGGGATKANRMPVQGDHYTAGPFPEYPTLAYTPNAKGGGRGRWEWDQQRPRFIGEELFAAGFNPAYSYFGGESVFTGQVATRPAVGRAVRIMTEGARWTGNGAIHFWQGQDAATGQYAANAPRAVFCRQWDWTFGPGQVVKRTFGIFNDTHEAAPITFTRTLNVGGREVSRKSTSHTVAPGESERFDENLRMPTVRERTEGELVLTLAVDGKEVFRDAKAVSVLNPSLSKSLVEMKAGELVVFDPKGAIAPFLKARSLEFTLLNTLKDLPAKARVLLIGPDAITKEDSASTSLAAFALGNKRVIVLEQSNPLHYQAVQPAALETAANEGRTAFIENAVHPVVRNLKDKDFFTWVPDEIVYRNAYLKPTRNATSIIQCHEQLKHSGLIEIPVGEGLLLLSQLRVGEALEANVVAQQLLVNLLDHAVTYRQEFREVVSVVEGAPQLAAALDKIGLRHERLTDPLQAITPSRKRIAVIAASPAHLKSLAASKAKVETFLKSGGHIVLNGLTPEGLEAYNALVGFDHMIRPFTRERVTFPAQKDPLTAGLSLADVALYSSERIFPWQEGNFVSSDTFSYVVDLEDVAPFAQYENDFVKMMSNGMVTADGWKYIVNVPAPEHPPLDFKLVLPKQQTIREIEWIGNTIYYPVTRVALLFDGKDEVGFPVKPSNELQVLALNSARGGKVLTLRLADWEKTPGKNAVTGLDNIRLIASRPSDFAERVRPMLNIGGLVHYPRGAGGIVLCNLKFQEQDDAPQNPDKKRSILAGVLRNLKAPFAGGKTIIAGADLTYTTLDLSKQANQYRTERGWFGDKNRSFKDLPGGRQLLAGVPFAIYDFPTSPVPTVVMLGGRDVPNSLPEEVHGIPVGRKVDALFFLQAARVDQPLNDQEKKEEKLVELAKYVVTYSNGEKSEVPVRLGLDVDDYRQKKPTPLPGAQIAWARPYEDSDQHAVAYAMTWTNPRPDVSVKSISLVYGKERRGVPALIAVTAGEAR